MFYDDNGAVLILLIITCVFTAPFVAVEVYLLNNSVFIPMIEFPLIVLLGGIICMFIIEIVRILIIFLLNLIETICDLAEDIMAYIGGNKDVFKYEPRPMREPIVKSVDSISCIVKKAVECKLSKTSENSYEKFKDSDTYKVIISEIATDFYNNNIHRNIDVVNAILSDDFEMCKYGRI